MGASCSRRGNVDDPGKPEDSAARFRERRLSVVASSSESNAGRRNSLMQIEVQDLHEFGEEPFPNVSIHTVPGLVPIPGGAQAKINQDRYLFNAGPVHSSLDGFAGVYDGHGRIGERTSEFVIRNVLKTLQGFLESGCGIPDALVQSHISVDTQLKNCPIDASTSGTTALSIGWKGNHMWIANTGDCRISIGRMEGSQIKAIELSIDQKPDLPSEMERILKAGGTVSPPGQNGEPARVWHNFRGLAMSRSIGDHKAEEAGVIPDPEITEHDLTENDKLLVMASDGVWEFLSSQQVMELAYSCSSASEACKHIVKRAGDQWQMMEGDYRDDISCIVVFLPLPPAASQNGGGNEPTVPNTVEAA